MSGGATQQRVIELARQGLRPSRIAREVQRSPETVYHYLWKARREGVVLPRTRTGMEPGQPPRHVTFFLDRNLTAALETAAARRGMEARDLARRIVTVCLADGLVDAVLDEERDGA